MATMHHLLIVTAMIFCLFSAAAVSKKGSTATFYTSPYVPSACYGYKDDGVKIAAASDEIWDNGNACGKKYKVKCLGPTNNGVPHPCKGKKSVVVNIVDYCPNCQGTIDLSQEAFGSIADKDAGKIEVSLKESEYGPGTVC